MIITIKIKIINVHINKLKYKTKSPKLFNHYNNKILLILTTRIYKINQPSKSNKNKY